MTVSEVGNEREKHFAAKVQELEYQLAQARVQFHDLAEHRANAAEAHRATLRAIQEKAEQLPFANEPYEVAGEIARIAREALEDDH